MVIAVQILTVFITIGAILYMMVKVLRIGQMYDEIDLKASDYTLYFEFGPKLHKQFEREYGID